jgi:hypothetical protein
MWRTHMKTTSSVLTPEEPKLLLGQTKSNIPAYIPQGPAKGLGVTKDGITVIDRHNSLCHLARKLLAEALSRIDLSRATEFANISVPMLRVIGNSTCVPTDSNDMVVYAQRVDRAGITRFVIDRAAVPSSKIQVILKATADRSKWVLITAFIGDAAEPEPWDRKATPRSADFWRSHALLWGSQPVVPRTATKPINVKAEQRIITSFRRLYASVRAQLGEFVYNRAGKEIEIFPTLWAEVDFQGFTRLSVDHPDRPPEGRRAYRIAALWDNPRLGNLDHDYIILSIHEDALAYIGFYF